MILKKVIQTVQGQNHEAARLSKYREMIRREAALGGQLFGPVPDGHRREFFCLDETTWVWHEEWIDQNGKRQVQTTRYDVRPTGILKAQEGKGYHAVSKGEAQNLIRAAKLYRQRVLPEIYNVSAN